MFLRPFWLLQFSLELGSLISLAGLIGVVRKFMQRIDLDSQFGAFGDVDGFLGLKRVDAVGSRRDPIVLLLVLTDGFVIGGTHEGQLGFDLELRR